MPIQVHVLDLPTSVSCKGLKDRVHQINLSLECNLFGGTASTRPGCLFVCYECKDVKSGNSVYSEDTEDSGHWIFEDPYALKRWIAACCLERWLQIQESWVGTKQLVIF